MSTYTFINVNISSAKNKSFIILSILILLDAFVQDIKKSFTQKVTNNCLSTYITI